MPKPEVLTQVGVENSWCTWCLNRASWAHLENGVLAGRDGRVYENPAQRGPPPLLFGVAFKTLLHSHNTQLSHSNQPGKPAKATAPQNRWVWQAVQSMFKTE